MLDLDVRFQNADHTQMRDDRDCVRIFFEGDLREGCADARLELAQALSSAGAQIGIAGTHAGELLGEAARDFRVTKSTPGSDVALAKARFQAGGHAKALARDGGSLRSTREVA